MSTRYCTFCEDQVGDDPVEIHEDPILEDRGEEEDSWVAHASCWRRHQAALDRTRRMFENLDKDYEEQTEIEETSVTEFDEDEFYAEIEDIEEILDEILHECRIEDA